MERRKTLKVNIASKIIIGGNSDIAIQSMTNTYNKDVNLTTKQIIEIFEAGAKLVRLTLPSASELKYIAQIKNLLQSKGYSNIPLIADIHFSPRIALKAAEYFDKIRINPGNYAENPRIINPREFIKRQLTPLVEYLSKTNKALRVGVNHGSLSKRMLEKYGDTEIGMVESAIEYLSILEELKFDNVLVSLKATKPRTVIYANRMLVNELEKKGKIYPLHLGVTEAGYGIDGRIKSAIGIGILLAEGIGDTIRVSLTEPPEQEIKPAEIIKNYALNLLKTTKTPPYFLPTTFFKQKTKKVANVGGNEKPKVFLLDMENYKMNINDDLLPDFIIKSKGENLVAINTTEKKEYTVKTKNILTFDNKEGFLLVPSSDVNFNLMAKLKTCSNLAVIVLLNGENPLEDQQKFYKLYDKFKLDIPVIYAREYKETCFEEFYIKAAIDLGYSFVNGRADGIMIINKHFDYNDVLKIAYKILQATGVRVNFTEYIACPSCGRTLFDIEKTTREIEKYTSQFKGIKIAVMGCIVNGLGEMADADFGYVGTKPGMISLYHNKILVKKDLPQERAVEELVKLIEKTLAGK